MSLDVYLIMEGNQDLPTEPQIFIREDGQVRSISREEWDEKYPGKDPIYTQLETDDSEVYWANITHNLNKMADQAGTLYKALWRPEELHLEFAEDLIPHLKAGLELLRADPEKFKQYNPSNGWGDYEGLVRFTEKYLNACKESPKARVRVSR